MVGFALGFLSKYWKLFAIAAAVLSVAFAINLFVRKYNDAIETAIEETHSANEWKRSSDAWKAAFKRSEGLREQETRQAISSLERENVVCNQRVASAIRSSTRIREITRVVPNENNQVCPAAGVITTDELRDALNAR